MPILKFAIRSSFILLITAGCLGCGLTGGTQRFVIASAEVPATPQLHALQLETLETAAAAGVRLTVPGIETSIGAFTAKDGVVLERSLSASLQRLVSNPVEDAASLRVKVLLRRHVVAAWWNAHILAIVNWAVVNERGDVVYTEQFYTVTRNWKRMWTLGEMKNEANRIIAHRIIGVSARLAAGEAISSFPEYANTYGSLASAQRLLPSRVETTAVMTPHEARQAPAEDIDWESFDVTAPVVW